MSYSVGYCWLCVAYEYLFYGMIEFRFFLFLFKRRLSLNFVDVLSTTTRD